MAKSLSMKARQASADDLLDLLGESMAHYDGSVVGLHNTESTLIYIAALYVQTATENLTKADGVNKGRLIDSIQATDVQIMGNVYSIEIKLADYYKFVDQGVNGWGQSQGSPFSFKKYPGRSGRKDSKMVTAIRQWIISQAKQSTALRGKNPTIKRTITAREGKQRKITDTSTQAAILATMRIRKKGIKATHFWSDTQSKMEQTAGQLFAEAIKIDIINSLRYGNDN